MKFLFLIQARSSSSRFPKKVLTEISDNKTLIEIVYSRIKIVQGASNKNIFILIPKNKSNDNLASFLNKKKISYWRGPEDNVYLRFFNFLQTQKTKPEYIFRICSDNPFIEPLFIQKIIDFLNKSKNKPDYISFKDTNEKPAILGHTGFFCEAIKYSTFIEAKKYLTTTYEKIHVTPIFYMNKKFITKFLPMPLKLNTKDIRFTIDTVEDFNLIKEIYLLLKNKDIFSYKDILAITHKDKKFINQMIKQIKNNKK